MMDNLKRDIRKCTVCRVSPNPLPVTPNPVLSGSKLSRIRIIGQAPGTLAHASGRPFTDPSGVRLRDWLGVTEDEFYNDEFFAVTPMGFCFPGQDNKGGDLPPRNDYGPNIMPLPHPSWRNNGWIKRHDWFADELRELKRRVRALIGS